MINKFIYTIIFVLIATPVLAAGYLGTKLPLPGNTIADKKAQANALGSVYMYASKQAKKCHKFQVVDTNVVNQPENVEYSQSGRKIKGDWTENWTVDACGEKIIVSIDFAYKRAGTAFNVENTGRRF